MRPVFPVFLLLAAACPAWASTTSAWNALDKGARATCTREIARLATKAKVSNVTGRVSGIGAANDADRYYALLMNGKTGKFPSQWLCLYDKRAKTAVAREIEKR